MCTPVMGNLIINPTKAILQTDRELLTWDPSALIEALLPSLKKIKIIISNGMEPIAVYKNRALPAVTRSA